MDWNLFKTLDYPKVSNVSCSFEPYEGDYFRMGPCEYGCIDVPAGGTIKYVYWAPSEAAFRRMVFKENTCITKTLVAPPEDLLLSPGIIRRKDVLIEARSGRHGRWRESDVTEFPGLTWFTVMIERVTYYFRGGTDAKDDEPFYGIRVCVYKPSFVLYR